VTAVLDSLAALGSWINAHALLPRLPLWSYALITLADTHVTSACVTLYLHRAQTHRSISFHPLVAHLMRFWLWVRTAMPTREWVAVHRCHHAHVDTPEDPHSPIVFGIWRVVLFGTSLYHTAAHDRAVIEQYGKGTPDDTIERRVYTPLSLLGPTLTLGSNVWIFGSWGIAMWLFEMAWIPFFAAGVINGLGHWWGYRNFETPDHSRNLPGQYWSLLTCGEALHNNHHHIQNSPRFAMRPGELDPGYWYFCALKALKLARARQESQVAVAIALLLLLTSASALAQPPATPGSKEPPQAVEPIDDALKYRDSVEVVGVTPIHGIGLPIVKVPSKAVAITPGRSTRDLRAARRAATGRAAQSVERAGGDRSGQGIARDGAGLHVQPVLSRRRGQSPRSDRWVVRHDRQRTLFDHEERLAVRARRESLRGQVLDVRPSRRSRQRARRRVSGPAIREPGRAARGMGAGSISRSRRRDLRFGDIRLAIDLWINRFNRQSPIANRQSPIENLQGLRAYSPGTIRCAVDVPAFMIHTPPCLLLSGRPSVCDVANGTAMVMWGRARAWSGPAL